MKAKFLAINSVLIAMYVVLSMFSIPLPIGIKLTFEHFPVVLAAIAWGPINAMLIGGVGEFLNQLLTYGLTPTTLLWMAPIIVRGFLVGISSKKFIKNVRGYANVKKEVPVALLLICVLTGIISSCMNTFAFYIDSKLFGYYNYAAVFGALAGRIIASVITSVIIAYTVKLVLRVIRRLI